MVKLMATDRITKTQYNELKNSYLEKNRSLHSLYSQINRENTVNKQLFFRLINRIREEEGLDSYYIQGKQKRKNSIIENLDKSPNHYN